MNIPHSRLGVLLLATLVAVAVCVALPAWSSPLQSSARFAPFGQAPVAVKMLASMRGGYDLGGGLVASFGLTRAVYVNGDLAAQVSVNIPNLAQINSAQANALAALTNDVTLVRNGPGNFADPSVFARNAGSIVIQNTLDSQQIQALTTLNTTVRNLGPYSALNIGNTLQQALVNSRGL